MKQDDKKQQQQQFWSQSQRANEKNKILYQAGFYWSLCEDISIFLDLKQTFLTVHPTL